MPLRYWYPKKLSSAQCSATYSEGTARGRHDATHCPSGSERTRTEDREGGRKAMDHRGDFGRKTKLPA